MFNIWHFERPAGENALPVSVQPGFVIWFTASIPKQDDSLQSWVSPNTVLQMLVVIWKPQAVVFTASARAVRYACSGTYEQKGWIGITFDATLFDGGKAGMPWTVTDIAR